MKVKSQVWDTLKALGGPSVTISAKAFKSRHAAACVLLTYLAAQSHMDPGALEGKKTVKKLVDYLGPRLYRKVAIAALRQGGEGEEPTLQVWKGEGGDLKSNGSRLSLGFILEDFDGKWRWVMWSEKAMLDLSDLLAAKCTKVTTPFIETLRSKI